ncbi:MAG TPA: co-chaperone YbbN, partial [Erythrobacter sp.]|nr:co-chaperone YbbN [Erythrobacter sp.]
EYADKGVVLKKVDVDAEKFIAAQFQVQSIPTVYAMFQGQPVADLTNARSESQLKQTLDQILAQLPLDGGGDNGAAGGQQQQQQDVSQFVTMAEQVLAEGDAERAAGVFGQVVQMAPDNAAAHAGLVRALVQAGHVEQAQAALSAAEANPAVAADPQIEQAKTALELAGNKVDDGQLAALRQQAEGGDMQARYDYAEAAFAAGDRDAAADELLAMVETDREWNEGAARAKLLQMFEAVGLEDPWVVATRRRLSRLLFG